MAQPVRRVALDAAERRSTSRPTLGRPGTIRIDAGEPIAILVSDLTRDGCRIETDAELMPDLAVQIGLAHIGLTAGRIVWRSQDQYGCRFNMPLAPGTITAAYGTSNIAVFPLTASPTSSAPLKLSPRLRLVIITGLVTSTWCGVVAGALYLGRLHVG